MKAKKLALTAGLLLSLAVLGFGLTSQAPRQACPGVIQCPVTGQPVCSLDCPLRK